MPETARSEGGTTAWEQAWRERYERPAQADESSGRAGRGRGGATSRRGRLRDLLIATSVLGITVSSIAVAQSGGEDPAVSAARGEGDAVTLGDRNPSSGGSTRETAIVADVGNSGLVLRPSNTAKGGRAVSATCDNDGQAPEDGCAVYVNKGTGAAASFRTQGSVPFALRETNTGRVEHLNADMVDGQHASAFLGRGERAADSSLLGGSPASAFLGATAKAADSDALDGQDSSAFLGATAKAADSDALDGQDSWEYVRRVGGVQADGDPVFTNLGFTVFKNNLGTYTITYPDGTFSPVGESCSSLFPAVTPLATGAQIANVEETGCRPNGGGQFKVRTFTHAGGAVDVAFTFVVAAVP